MSTVYLLHFDRQYIGNRRDARAKRTQRVQHYLGYCADLDARLEQHRNGTGARLMQVVREAGISFIVARTWTGGRTFERRLKNQKHAPRLCPICNPEVKA